MSTKEIIYESTKRSKVGVFRTLFIMVLNGYQKRELIYQLFRRDFLMMYKKSFLGFGWHVVTPLIAMGSWIFLNASGVLDAGDTGVPYPVFVLVGITFWNLFTHIFINSMKTLTIAKGFITQVNFPHEVLFFKQILQQLANFLISLIIVFIVMAIFGVAPHWGIIFIPLMTLPLIFLAGSTGLLLSIFDVISQDTSKFFEVFISFLLFVTPIAYSMDKVSGKFATILKLNPLTYLVGEMRNVFLFGEIQYLKIYIYVALFTFLLFIVSLRFFYVAEDKVMEKMN